jgi:sialate O-acetylesterase
MKLLVNGWRKAFADQSLAFYYAQISPYLYSARKTDADPKTWQDLARFWEAQTHCLDVIPNTGMIVTTDIPEDLSDIHPSYKWTVGERLALQALNKTYGRTDLVCDGPMVNTVTLTDEHVVIDFKNADGGLMTRDGKAADWFTVRTKWNRYVKTNVELKGNKAYIKRKDLSNPIEVRFGWDETAQPNLVNGAGLPAVPFRWIITPPVKNVKK